MIALTKERLLERLLALPAIIEKYDVRDPAFVPDALAWLQTVETALGQIRHPLASLASAERGRVLAVLDGLRDPELKGENCSARQAERAGAAASLARVEAAMRLAVMRLDDLLNGLAQEMALLLAHVSSSRPIPLPNGEQREIWLRRVWEGLLIAGEQQSLQSHAYLSARLAWVDRLYLLDDLLGNLLGQPGLAVSERQVQSESAKSPGRSAHPLPG